MPIVERRSKKVDEEQAQKVPTLNKKYAYFCKHESQKPYRNMRVKRKAKVSDVDKCRLSRMTRWKPIVNRG